MNSGLEMNEPAAFKVPLRLCRDSSSPQPQLATCFKHGAFNFQGNLNAEATCCFPCTGPYARTVLEGMLMIGRQCRQTFAGSRKPVICRDVARHGANTGVAAVVGDAG